MGSYANPLVGSSWNNQGSWGSMQPFGGTNPINIPGVPQPGSPGMSSPGQNAGRMTGWGNPGGFGNPLGPNEINRNVGLNNVISGQMKNYLAPQFANLFGQYGQGAGNFFGNLMNLGSPYYQQKQAASFGQGVQQNQNAQGQALQQLRSQGFGSTPSGATAAMIGGMNQQGSQNLAQNYLQNLFQNEQMQLQGAQGLQQTASMFNPAQMLGGSSVGANVSPQSTFFQNLQSMLQGLGSYMGGAGSLSGGM